MRVFVTRLLPVELLQPIVRAGWNVDMFDKDEDCPRPVFLQRSADVDAVLVQVTDALDTEFFELARSLKVVATCSVGYDHIDIDAAHDREITVCNAPAEDAIRATAETAVALLLSVAKRITRLHIAQKSESLPDYSIFETMGVPVRDKVTGIVGLGRIGTEIARMMSSAFGNSILYYNRSARVDAENSLGATRCELPELMAGSDFVFVTVPLTAETENLIDETALEKLNKTAIVVNISRAGVIDEEALVDLLTRGRIHGAGLDVYHQSTTRCDHPNLVLTGHMANGEIQSLGGMIELAVKNIVAALRGEIPPTPVGTRLEKS